MIRLSTYLFALTIVLIPSLVSAQWTQPAGKFYVKPQVNVLVGKDGFDLNGDIFPADENYTVVGLSTYAEYGVSSGNTLTFNGSLIGFASHGDESGVFTGPLMFGNRNQLMRNESFAWSSEVRGGLDIGVGSENLATNSEYDFRPSRPFGLRAEGVSQFGFSKSLFFATLEVGARLSWYKPDVAGDLIGTLAVGMTGLPLGVVPLIYSTVNWPFKKPDLLNVAGVSPSRYIGVGIGLGWWFTETFGLAFNFGGAPYATSNAATPALGFGVQFQN